MTTLPSYATRYLRQSGAIRWDGEALSSAHLDEELCRILHVVALLEEDTAISARQGRSLGVDGAADIGAFLSAWEMEEAEHARAFRFLLARQTYPPPRPRPEMMSFRRCCLARLPAGAFRRFPQTEFVYCALGAAAEYVTIVTYSELAKLVDQSAVVALLRAIGRQEGRHFAFFVAAARVRGETMSSFNGRVARRVFGSIWEPPGVPSIGVDGWLDIFAPLGECGGFRGRIEHMDRVVDTIPHLEGLHLMSTFLDAHVPASDHQRTADRPTPPVGVEPSKHRCPALDQLARSFVPRRNGSGVIRVGIDLAISDQPRRERPDGRPARPT